MVTLHCGRAGSGKTSAIFERIFKGAAQKRKQILIVPEMLSHEMERRMLKTCGNAIAQFAEVKTFKRIASGILRESGIKPELLDGGGRVLAMYRAVQKAESGLTYYKTMMARPEMVEKLLLLTDEMKACRIVPEDLLKISINCAAGDGKVESKGEEVCLDKLRKTCEFDAKTDAKNAQKGAKKGQNAANIAQKIGDIGLIYAAYCNILEKIGLDDKDLLTAASQDLRTKSYYKDYDIYFDGFVGFTAQEFEMVAILLERCHNMEVAILRDDSDVIFYGQARLAARMKDMAKRYGCEFEEKMYLSRARIPAIAHIEQNLFGYNEAKFGGDCECIKILEANSPQEECALAAAQIRTLVASGARYRDICVAAGNMEEYAPIIEMQFAKYEVPFFLAQKSDVLAKPVMAALAAAVAAVSQNMGYESTFAYLKSGLSVLESDEVDLLENYVLTWNIRGAEYFKEFTRNPYGFDLSREQDGKLLLPRIEEIRRKLAAPLGALMEQMRQCKMGEQYAAALGKFLETTDLGAKIERKIALLNKMGRNREAAEYAQLFDILSGAIAQFAKAMEGVELDNSEFLRLWRLMLAQYDVAAIPVALDDVKVGNFDRLSFSGMQHLVVIGAVDGQLPPVGKSSGLLSERDRATLETEGLELTQTAEEHAYEKQSQIYRGFASAQETITVMYPTQDYGGGKTRQSYLLRRLCDILPNAQIAHADKEYMLTARKPSLELACVSLGEAGIVYGDTARQIALEIPGNAELFESLRRYSAAPRGPIKSADLIAAAYGNNIHMTASRAEKIASCRFSYFMQYGLRARERKIAKFGAPETGTMLHAVVECAIAALCEGRETDAKLAAKTFMDEYIASALSGLQFQSARTLALFKRMRRMVTAIVVDVWQELQSSKFKPISFEMTFGENAENGCIEIKCENMTLELVGQIDRVDGFVRDGTLYIKVVDYKTGQKSFRLSDVLAGINMQMFIYLLLLRGGEEALTREATAKFGEGISSVETAGVLYIPAKTPFVAAEYGETDEEILAKQQKDIRRIGLVTDDEDVLRAMEQGEQFRFLPVSFKKDGTLAANSSVAGKKQFEQLVRKTDRVLKKIAGDIASGDIEAEPIMTAPDQTVCRFCAFADACHFDETMKKDKFRMMQNLASSEVFAMLDAEEVQNGR